MQEHWHPQEVILLTHTKIIAGFDRINIGNDVSLDVSSRAKVK